MVFGGQSGGEEGKADVEKVRRDTPRSWEAPYVHSDSTHVRTLYTSLTFGPNRGANELGGGATELGGGATEPGGGD